MAADVTGRYVLFDANLYGTDNPGPSYLHSLLTPMDGPAEFIVHDARGVLRLGDRMLQLEDDIAAARIEANGTWSVTKLFPDAPIESETTTIALASMVVSFEEAGPGGVLLRTPDSATLIRVGCALDDEAANE
jgi:ABC-type molybdate transport system ATPase subunit